MALVRGSGPLAALLATALSTSAVAVEPVTSWDRLTTGNGHGFGVWAGARLEARYDRPYKHPTANVRTPNALAGAVAFGLSAIGERVSLASRPVVRLGYVDSGHVIRVVQTHGSLRAVTYAFAPWSLDAPGVALVLEVTNISARPEPHAAAWLEGLPDSPRWDLPDLAEGETRWVGALTGPQGVEALDDPAGLLTSELAAWEAWRVEPPEGLSRRERRVWRQSESVLRMAQVREAAPAGGAVLASLPPGGWWIAWVRDMAYALVALARSGHVDEAAAGVDFWVGAEAGAYREYVGVDYPVSVTRYYGDGAEESDVDERGPNIEFDGFGLALWAAHHVGSEALDSAADTLLALRDPETGLIAPDSSIWEVHWNGAQKRFAYTTIVAARGLCDAGRAEEARALRDALVRHLVDPQGALAQSFEELRDGVGAVDAAVLEAINFGLIDPAGELAGATVRRLTSTLALPHGKGLARNDDGGGYDRQEWVFVGLRLAAAQRRMGLLGDADATLDRYTLYADLNHGLLPELLHRRAATYRGATPMVGFGAGAWQLAILARERPGDPPHVARCFGGGP